MPLEPDLVRYLRRKWHDRADISDLMQETYARVYEAARRERPQQVKAFLFATARNLMIDKLRRVAVVSIEMVADIDQTLVITDEPDPERQVSARQELRALQSALDELPERCRQIVWMKKVEGYSQREIAQRMGVSEVVVEHQVGRAVRLLAEAIYSRRGGNVTVIARQKTRSGRSRS